MICRELKALGLALASVFCGCSWTSDRQAEGLLQASGEEWVFSGMYTTPRRESGPPKENWIGTMRASDQTMHRLIDIPMFTPGGQRVLFPRVAYHQPEGVLICSQDDFYERNDASGHFYDDVWRHDLRTGQSRWIAKARWRSTMGFVWSPDGERLAFVGSTLGSPEAEVVEYHVRADRLEVVATDACGDNHSAASGDAAVRLRRPVYSRDGNWLYYISPDQHVMRVDLRSRKSEQLPFTDAIAVLGVKDGQLVYARELGKDRDARFDIVKADLEASDNKHLQRLYLADQVLHFNCLSPSGRFSLFESRAGYYVDVRLVDIESGRTYSAYGLCYDGGFQPQSTAFCGAATTTTPVESE